MKRIIKTEIIEDYMKENKLSKSKFCKMCKISPYTYDKIMKDDANFGIRALFKISIAMKIDLFRLFY